MVLMELSVVPIGAAESISPWVARCVDIIDRSGLDYELHAAGTIVEGPLDQVTSLLRECIEAVASDCHRVTCLAKFDYKQGETGRLYSNVDRVVAALGRTVRTGAGS